MLTTIFVLHLVPVTAKGQCIEVDATKFRSNVYAADGIAYNPIKLTVLTQKKKQTRSLLLLQVAQR